MPNFEAFHPVITSSINLLFLKSWVCNFFSNQILRKRLLMKIFDCQSLKRIQRFQNMRWDDNRLKIFHFLYVIIMGQACVENKDRSWYRMRWVSKVEPIFVKALKACSIYDKTKCKQRRFVNKNLIEAQWAETPKKVNFDGIIHCWPQRLKSTFFEIFSSGRTPDWGKNFKIFDFSL